MALNSYKNLIVLLLGFNCLKAAETEIGRWQEVMIRSENLTRLMPVASLIVVAPEFILPATHNEVFGLDGEPEPLRLNENWIVCLSVLGLVGFSNLLRLFNSCLGEQSLSYRFNHKIYHHCWQY